MLVERNVFNSNSKANFPSFLFLFLHKGNSKSNDDDLLLNRFLNIYLTSNEPKRPPSVRIEQNSFFDFFFLNFIDLEFVHRRINDEIIDQFISSKSNNFVHSKRIRSFQSDAHSFLVQNFHSPVICYHCQNALIGVQRQGSMCQRSFVRSFEYFHFLRIFFRL